MVDVAYHMKSRRWSRDEALAFVQSKRPQTCPHHDYLAGLLEYEAYLASR